MGVYEDIQEFHEKFRLDYDEGPRELPNKLKVFRLSFMLEELREYEASEHLAGQLDALVDLVYVALGTAYLQGFDFNEAWRRVHAANMKKKRAEKAVDSKRNSVFDVVKPEGWAPPDLSDLVSPVCSKP